MLPDFLRMCSQAVYMCLWFVHRSLYDLSDALCFAKDVDMVCMIFLCGHVIAVCSYVCLCVLLVCFYSSLNYSMLGAWLFGLLELTKGFL